MTRFFPVSRCMMFFYADNSPETKVKATVGSIQALWEKLNPASVSAILANEAKTMPTTPLTIMRERSPRVFSRKLMKLRIFINISVKPAATKK